MYENKLESSSDGQFIKIIFFKKEKILSGNSLKNVRQCENRNALTTEALGSVAS